MYVKSLYIKEEKHGKVKDISKGFFQRDKGLVGDINAQGGLKQVSIISSEGREKVKNKNGLCTKKFYANIEIHGLNIDKLYKGQKLKIGNTIQEITVIGKECFPDCDLLEEESLCPLPTSVIFTRVIEEGTVEIGNPVDVEWVSNIDLIYTES